MLLSAKNFYNRGRAMYDPQRATVVGNIIINGPELRNFLKKSHYFLTWDRNTHTITLEANHFYGGVVLFKIKDASHAEAKNLAAELGLEGAGDDASIWCKWNPIFCLEHNGSAEAEELRVEMLKLGIPCIVREVRPDSTYALRSNQSLFRSDMWSQLGLLLMIREAAARYRGNLKTIP
ncbi:MAG: hypothetical protein HY506_01470 [Candidatus Yanofskybacteria bacterium]|nr:hypothetical protein [Candidatus Yanofskybacteria bacterium]